MTSLENANEDDDGHKKDLLSFADAKLEQYAPHFQTEEVKKLIIENQKTLRGVFFTRKTAGQGANAISTIWRQWQEIVSHSNESGIYNAALPSPSLQGTTVKNAIADWTQAKSYADEHYLAKNLAS